MHCHCGTNTTTVDIYTPLQTRGETRCPGGVTHLLLWLMGWEVIAAGQASEYHLTLTRGRLPHRPYNFLNDNFKPFIIYFCSRSLLESSIAPKVNHQYKEQPLVCIRFEMISNRLTMPEYYYSGTKISKYVNWKYRVCHKWKCQYDRLFQLTLVNLSKKRVFALFVSSNRIHLGPDRKYESRSRLKLVNPGKKQNHCYLSCSSILTGCIWPK